METSQPARRGLTPIEVLEEIAVRGHLSTAADFAKGHHYSIALLASSGFITSLTRDGLPSPAWRVTYAGHTFLERTAL